jgi:hypothetical protein
MPRRFKSGVIVFLTIFSCSLFFLPFIKQGKTQSCVELLRAADSSKGVKVSPSFSADLQLANLASLVETVHKSFRVTDQITVNGIALSDIKECISVISHV